MNFPRILLQSQQEPELTFGRMKMGDDVGVSPSAGSKSGSDLSGSFNDTDTLGFVSNYGSSFR